TLNIQQPGKLTADMNADLCSMMLSNLIKNAITHNIPKGHVTINILDDALVITNTGIAEPLDREQVFLRFHKGAPSSDSTGLGLAIVKTIADLYGIGITYQFTDVH